MNEPDERTFSYQTVAAVIAAILIPAVIFVGEYKRANQQERMENGQKERLDCDGAEEANRPVENLRQIPYSSGGADSRGHVDDLQPRAGLQADARGEGDGRVFDAIRQVESGGNDAAIGDGGLAHGPLQIHRDCWLDGGGKAADYPAMAHVRAASEQVAVNYWKRYGAVTDEQKARCWNSGPKWRAKYHLTNTYWAKVQAATGER